MTHSVAVPQVESVSATQSPRVELRGISKRLGATAGFHRRLEEVFRLD